MLQCEQDIKDEREHQLDLKDIIIGRIQNCVATVCYAAILISAPGLWKLSAFLLCLTYLRREDNQ